MWTGECSLPGVTLAWAVAYMPMSVKIWPCSHRVVALAYDQLCTFEFGCTVEVFALPRPELAVPWYEFAVCAARRGPLRAAGGLSVRVPHGLQGARAR